MLLLFFQKRRRENLVNKNPQLARLLPRHGGGFLFTRFSLLSFLKKQQHRVIRRTRILRMISPLLGKVKATLKKTCCCCLFFLFEDMTASTPLSFLFFLALFERFINIYPFHCHQSFLCVTRVKQFSKKYCCYALLFDAKRNQRFLCDVPLALLFQGV